MQIKLFKQKNNQVLSIHLYFNNIRFLTERSRKNCSKQKLHKYIQLETVQSCQVRNQKFAMGGCVCGSGGEAQGA